MHIRQLGKAVAAAAVLVGLNACASIPKRAWDNGANMSRHDAYWRAMRGERGFHVTRSLYNAMDPARSFHQVRPYQPFSRW